MTQVPEKPSDHFTDPAKSFPHGAPADSSGFDPRQLQEAIRLFLSGLGVSSQHPDLQSTPERVAQAWTDEFLAGYGQRPEQVLGERYPVQDPGPVVVSGLRFVSVCPHHLLPYSGEAQVAYLPNQEVIGLGRLASLVDCFARRLVLQETLTRQIAAALMEHLGARGAACLMTARQGCMALRGSNRENSRCTTVTYLGAFETDQTLQSLFLRAGRDPAAQQAF